MTKKTEHTNDDEMDIISSLTSDLKPVKRQRPVWLRAAFALVAAALLIRVVSSFFGSPGMPLSEMMTPAFAVEMGLFSLAGIMAVIAALRLSKPDVKIRPLTYILLGLPLLILIGIHFYGYMQMSSISLVEHAHEHDTFLHEITDLFFIIALPTAMLFYMVGRGAPTFKMWAGYSIVLATACFGAVALRMFCGMDHGAHLLLFHYLPVLGFSVIGIALGRFLLRW